MRAWERILWEIELCSGYLRKIRRALIIMNVFLFTAGLAIAVVILYVLGVIS